MRIENTYFEMTNLCNLNCITCYNRSGLNHARQELSFQQLVASMDRLSTEFGCQAFAFAGGEPLLHSELTSLLAYIQEHTEFHFSFVTNGTLDNPAFIDLLHQNPDRIRLQISLDGSCEEINSLTRGQGSFAKTIAFLDKVAAPDFRPIVKMVISQKNLHDVEPFYHMVIAHGGAPDYAFINRSGNAVDDWDDKAVAPRQKIQVLKLLDRLNSTSSVEAPLPHSTSGCPLSDPERPLSILIKNDGTLQPCQLLYDSAYSFGNILTDTREQIEQGFQRIRQLVDTRQQQDFQCHRCPMRTQCQKGCPASAVYHCGDPLGDDGECLTRKLEIVDFELRRQLLDRPSK